MYAEYISFEKCALDSVQITEGILTEDPRLSFYLLIPYITITKMSEARSCSGCMAGSATNM